MSPSMTRCLVSSVVNVTKVFSNEPHEVPTKRFTNDNNCHNLFLKFSLMESFFSIIILVDPPFNTTRYDIYSTFVTSQCIFIHIFLSFLYFSFFSLVLVENKQNSVNDANERQARYRAKSSISSKNVRLLATNSQR